MKIFALVSTTAVTGRRVEQPAPGFVNEQGGYWADQTYDQSQHYQQPPQPSYQQQQGQKPQCANGYFFTAPGAPEAVWMEKIGENDEKPLYAGWFEDGEKFLYWSWDRQANPTNAVVQAVPGNWYFGSSVGDVNAIASSTTYGLRYCPTDQEVKWNQFNSSEKNVVSLVAGQNGGRFQYKPFACCRSFTATIDGKLMEFNNSNQFVNNDREERQYFQTANAADRKYLYFKFDEDQNSPVPLPKQALSGRWYIGSGTISDSTVIFDDNNVIATESINYAFTSCPNDPLVMKTFSKDGNKIAVDLECNPSPTKSVLGDVGTCDDLHDPTIFFNNNKNECKLDQLHDQLIHSMKEQLTKFRPDANENGNAGKYYPMIPGSIRGLLNLKCLATTSSGRLGCSSADCAAEGYEFGCSEVCNNIKSMEKPEDMAMVLSLTMHMVHTRYQGKIFMIKGPFLNFESDSVYCI